MNRETSVYLDAIRFSAAMAVFFSHIAPRYFADGFLWQFSSFGSPAVVVFFVLSGFVIGYVTARKETSGRDYAISRAARIYSVAIPTLLLTGCVDWVGSQINPDSYAQLHLLIGDGVRGLPAALTFLNMSWRVDQISIGTNAPYWSLGYEVIYYALFGVAFYCRGAARIIGCILIAAIAGPRIVALFPLWLIGWAAYHFCSQHRLTRGVGWVVFVGSIGAMIIYGLESNTSVNLSAHDPWEIAQDYILGGIFAANLIGFHTVSDSFRPILSVIGKPVRWLAGATFTLYLLHLPILHFIQTVSPWPRSSWLYRAAVVVIPLAAVFCVAQVTERRKNGWYRAFDWLLRSWPKSVPDIGVR